LQFGDLLERFREHKDHVEAEAKAAAMEDSQARLVRLEVQNQSLYTHQLRKGIQANKTRSNVGH
jgi:hypothetical protein